MTQAAHITLRVFTERLSIVRIASMALEHLAVAISLRQSFRVYRLAVRTSALARTTATRSAFWAMRRIPRACSRAKSSSSACGHAVIRAGVFSINNGGSCGVLLTLAGGTTSDKCHLSGSASPQCDDVFGADVDFPAPTLSTDGATLRFVYNCDPDGESGLIPATANTIAATECGCDSEASFFSDVCIRDDGDLGLSDELLCGAFGGDGADGDRRAGGLLRNGRE